MTCAHHLRKSGQIGRELLKAGHRRGVDAAVDANFHREGHFQLANKGQRCCPKERNLRPGMFGMSAKRRLERKVTRRRTAGITAISCVSVVAIGCGLVGSANTGSATTESRTTHALLEGAYVGRATPSRMAAFGAATRTHPTIASDSLPSLRGWAGMDGSNRSFWSKYAHRWAGSPYTLSLAVQIIPSGSAGNAVGTLATGATGAYDSHFVTLAQNLIAANESNAFLRLGWEFDSGSSAWSATSPGGEANYAEYFRQIVTAMRSVPGENFKFVWNPDLYVFQPNSTYDVSLAYPGSSYVDDIGVDAYDRTIPQDPTNSWPYLLPALTAADQFAAAQGKPLAIPEWGVQRCSGCGGLGDDPSYINSFTTWMKDPANNVAYESIFDSVGRDGINAEITGGNFPRSLATFIADLTDRKPPNPVSQPPANTPEAPSVPLLALAGVLVLGGMGWVRRRILRERRSIT